MEVQIARGAAGAVVSGHPAATRVAVDMYRSSGNIIDAALAGAAMLCTALPHACGLGGDCFILVHHAGTTWAVNGSGLSPARLPTNISKEQLASGALSGAVPGMLGAWEALHQKFGRASWSELFAPAIALAKAGIECSPDLAKAMIDFRAGLESDDGCRALFPAGAAPRLVQSALARALAEVAAHGSQAFYYGALGESLCQTVAARGGVLSMGDLGAYAPIWAKPLELNYRGYDVRVCPPNSFGLLMLLQLGALAGVPMHAAEMASAQRLNHLMSATRAALQIGTPLICDPRIAPQSAAQALSPAAMAQLQAVMRAPGERPALPRAHGTAVISVADKDGNAVTIVQSIFTPFGSLVGDPDTGIVLNNRLLGFSTDPASPNVAAPSKHPAHTLSPAMVFKEDRLAMVLGTPGGSGQTITLTQVLSNMVDHALPLDQAIAAPRWSMDITGNFVVEPEISDPVVNTLVGDGFAVKKATAAQRFFFGSAECIAIEDDRFIAVADHRRDARAAAL